MFVYQTLDAIDGKQARRTGTNNQLGEIFDHGCDAISMFCVAISGVSAGAVNQYPYLMLCFIICIEVLNYMYHWQTYVSGTLYFKRSVCSVVWPENLAELIFGKVTVVKENKNLVYFLMCLSECVCIV